MENNYINDLLIMVNDINSIPNSSLRDELIYKFSSYGAYVYYRGLITQRDFIKIISKIKDDSEEKLYEQERDLVIKELTDNNDILNRFYRDYIHLYKNTFLPKENEFVCNKNIIDEFTNFLKYINCYDLYLDLLRKNKISFTSILDHSICINDRYDSYILIKEDNYFYEYFVLTHELAHAYENRLMSNKLVYFDSPYNIEILSILFNRIFIEFLTEKNVFNNKEINLFKSNFELNYYNFLHQAYFITEAIKHLKYEIVDYDLLLTNNKKSLICSLSDHNYAIGGVVSLKLLNEWRKENQLFIKRLPELVNFIHNIGIKELLDTYNDENTITEEMKRLIIK